MKKIIQRSMLLISSFIFLMQIVGVAQLSNIYTTFTQTQGTYVPLTSGNIIGIGTGVGAVGDSWTSPAITIPSTNIAGVVYTTAYVTSNGLLKFGGTAPATTLYTGINTLPVGGGIHFSVFNADLTVVYTSAASEISWALDGPEIVFQWKGFRRWAQTEEFNFQARINRVNGDITYVYDLVSGPGTGTSYFPQVGFALSNTNYLAREVANNTTSSWAASTPAATSTATLRFTNSTTNPKTFVSGLTYKWTALQCVSPPVPGNTIASTTSTCYGQVVNLNAQNTIAGAGLVYQWQQSSDNITFSDILGANTATYAAIATAPLYYRLKVTCLSGPADGFSVPVFVDLIAKLNTSTGGSVCGSGSVPLQATANAGVSIDWFEQATGGPVLGTGNTFNTPVISTTTTFYASPRTTASGTVKIGDGASTSSTYPNPLYSLWANTHNQYVITAQELQDQGLLAGNITSLGVTSTAGTTASHNINIKIAHTTQSNAAAFNTTATFTNVFSTPLYNPVIGVNTFVFSTPFVWDGVSNILIDYCFDDLTSTATTSNTVLADPTPYISTIHVNRTSTTSVSICDNTTTNLTTYSIRPQFILGSNNVACYGARTPVVANVASAAPFAINDDITLCNGSIQQLSVVTGSGAYNQFYWAPATHLYTDALATIPYNPANPAAVVYFKSTTPGATMVYAHAVNTTLNCESRDTMNIVVLPSNVAVQGILSSACLSGSTTFRMLGSPNLGAATIQWQSSTDNINFTDIIGANDTVYTSPTINNTQYYRVSLLLNNNACAITSIADTLVINNPSLTTAANINTCDTGSFVLQATPGAGYGIKWYDAPTSTNVLHQGNSFTTPPITVPGTTTYYASAYTGSQDTFFIGTGTSTSSGFPNPFSKVWGGNRHQYMYTAAELTAAGMSAGPLYNLALDVVAISTSGTAAQRTLEDLTISLANTTSSNLSGGFQTVGLQQVYNGSFLPTAIGWNNFTFTTPFIWDGFSNIVVEFVSNSGNTGGGGQHTIRFTTTPFVSTYYRYADNVLPATAAGFLASTTGTNLSSSNRANIRFTNDNYCEGTRQPISVTVLPKVTAAITPNGNVGLCDGASQTLNAVNTASSYLWLRNGAAIPNSNSSSLLVNTIGNYRLVTIENGCSDTSDIVVVALSPSPTVDLGADINICPGTNATLTAQTAVGNTFLWDNSSTNATRTITQAGTYTVIVTNIFGCTNSDTVTVGLHPVPMPDLGPDIPICINETRVLNPGNFDAYLWNNGSSTNTLTLSDSGWYAVEVTNAFGCKATDSIYVYLASSASVEGFTFIPYFFEEKGKVQFAPINPRAVQYYDWSFGDGSTNSSLARPFHTYPNDGRYLVTLEVSNDQCPPRIFEQEITLNFDATGVADLTELKAKLYPNPAQDMVTIELDDASAQITAIEVYDITGRMVLHQNTTHASKISINTQMLVSGTYSVKIATNKGLFRTKLDILK